MFNYHVMLKNGKNFYECSNSEQNNLFFFVDGTSMGVFDPVFRIFTSHRVFSVGLTTLVKRTCETEVMSILSYFSYIQVPEIYNLEALDALMTTVNSRPRNPFKDSENNYECKISKKKKNRNCEQRPEATKRRCPNNVA